MPIVDMEEVPTMVCPHCHKVLSIAVDELYEHVLNNHMDIVLSLGLPSEQIETFKKGMQWTRHSTTKTRK